MMKWARLFLVLFSACLTGVLAACSSQYVAVEGVAAKTIFEEACSGCHQPLNLGGADYFALDKDQLNAGWVAGRIVHGGLVMPAFPHIQGEELRNLSYFVLEHSTQKE